MAVLYYYRPIISRKRIAQTDALVGGDKQNICTTYYNGVIHYTPFTKGCSWVLAVLIGFCT